MTKACFDWTECVRLSGNNEDIANEMLDLFIKELPMFQDHFKQAIQANDVEQLQYHAHKLHGACCYVGVPKLKALTEQLELQSHQPDTSKNLISEVNQEIDQVIQAINHRK